MPAATGIQYENAESNGTATPLTMYDKIWRDHVVHTSDGTCLIYIDRHLVHEVTSPQAFEGLRMTGRKVRRPDCTLVTVDHNVPTHSRKGFKDVKSFITQQDSKTQVVALEQNVVDFGLTYFGMDDNRQGIVHVIGPEQGFTLPGTTVVCGDSHTSTHGAFGALAFGIGTSEVEHVLATQTLILKQSKNMRINVSGKLAEGVTSKDVVLHICGVIGTAGGTGHVIEFCGDVFEAMSMEARMSVCNMAIEAGARAGMVAPDETTFAYLKGRPLAPKGSKWEMAMAYWKSMRTDRGAVFDKDVNIDGSEIVPTITWGTSPEEVVPITGCAPDPSKLEAGSTKRIGWERALFYMGLEPNQKMQDVTIQKAFIGSCTNSRIEDIRSAAAVARGRKVSEGVYAMVVPGSGLVKEQAEAEGLDKVLIEAGFDWREPGCSMCLAMNPDKLEPHERCAATSNRNFEGRQGALGRTHLMSPAMAAAAAVTGKLTDVRELLRTPAVAKEGAAAAFAPIDQLTFHSKPFTLAVSDEVMKQPDAKDSQSTGTASASAGMPKFIKLEKGIAAPLRKANVDTDCIIPKQFLKTIKRTGLGVSAFFELRYEDDGITEKPDFVLNQDPYRAAPILIAKDNFGCGSSREHAPWSLLDFGIKCIIAPSFADIFFSNCFKNGMLPIKLPGDKVEELMVDAEAKKRLTVDLPAQKVIRECGTEISFEVDSFKKHCLINGLDDIGLTMEKFQFIDKFEAKRKDEFAWLESDPKQKHEVRVSASKGTRFYVRTARAFLQGVPATGDNPEKAPADEIVVTAIGSAIDKAVRVANELETDGDATVSKINTGLVGRAPQIALTMKVKRTPKALMVSPASKKDGQCGCSSEDASASRGKAAIDW